MLVEALVDRLKAQLNTIYGGIIEEQEQLDWLQRFLVTMGLSQDQMPPEAHRNIWSEKDIALITYGDSILSEGAAPLQVLESFLSGYLKSVISWVHILPFHPWTSDDGFAVMDYSSVNEALGDWCDITSLSQSYKVMADVVLNHCSSRSAWFENFRQGLHPGADYFYVPEQDFDTSKVVRPRTSPLLVPVETSSGERSVWCTFSADQVDFDFRNPAVLNEFLGIIRQQLDAGVRVFRLDAVAFVWKASGTTCVNQSQTHAIVRLLRTMIECAAPEAVLITETNLPNRENLSYFGNANQAHAVYNFSLPPLLLDCLLSGNSRYLSQWMMSMPPAQDGTTYFNFIASHDGIGLRPAEGLLSEAEIERLIDTMASFGGLVSYRETDGDRKPYEINIALRDALTGTYEGVDDLGIQRFLCAHAVMLGLEGIPAFYIHSLIGTRNDHERVNHTGRNRSINRHQWGLDKLEQVLQDEDSEHATVLRKLSFLIALRQRQPAFHPNATQFTLRLATELFGFWRQSQDRRQSIFCVYNVSSAPQTLPLAELNLILTDEWYDLISGTRLSDASAEMTLSPYQVLWISNQYLGF
ncbi:MAG: sugar phosphorylase [Halieaceae bacterium]